MTPRIRALRKRGGWELTKAEWEELAREGQLTPAHLSWRSSLAYLQSEADEHSLSDYLRMLRENDDAREKRYWTDYDPWLNARIGQIFMSIAKDIRLETEIDTTRLGARLALEDLKRGNFDHSQLPQIPPPQRGFTLSDEFYGESIATTSSGPGSRRYSQGPPSIDRGSGPGPTHIVASPGELRHPGPRDADADGGAA